MDPPASCAHQDWTSLEKVGIVRKGTLHPRTECRPCGSCGRALWVSPVSCAQVLCQLVSASPGGGGDRGEQGENTLRRDVRRVSVCCGWYNFIACHMRFSAFIESVFSH